VNTPMTVPSERFATGVPGLDTVLDGGLSRNALVFIVGPPGAGKTILATQILFSAIRAGLPALVLTAFSEDHSKLLEHLRPLTFFDDEIVSTKLQLVTLASLIGADGQLDASLAIQTVRQAGARVVMIDGFQGVPELVSEPIVARRLLEGWSKLAQVLRVAVLVTMEGDGRDPQHGAALTMSDVVIDLDYQLVGWRHVRRLDVVKQRGRAALAGLHSYTITDDGIVVYPRLEARLPEPRRQEPGGQVAFGVPELDALLGGGVPVGTAAVLAAAPGIGKTTLALYWALADARPEHGTLFLSFHANPAQLEAKAAALGLDLAGAVASGSCTVRYVAPVAIDPDAVGGLLLDALSPSTRRVVIDDLGGLIWELGTRARDYLAALALHLAHAGATTLFLLETGTSQIFSLDTAYTLIAPIAETVLLLEEQEQGDQPKRVVRVLTMRFGAYTTGRRTAVLESVHPV
jgi:circadian clock protein KaiC